MKKQTLFHLLILFILSITNTYAEEKYNLTPHLQMGDQWKMRFSFYAKDFKRSMNIDETLKSMKGASLLDLKKGLKINSTWQMECIHSTDTSVQIKSTLLSFDILEGRENMFNYFDSFYPLSLSNEITDQIDSTIGKYCVAELNFKTDSVHILSHNFSKEKSEITLLSFMDKTRGSVLFNLTYRYKTYGLVGPDFLSMAFKAWVVAVPTQEVSGNSIWSISNNYEVENTEFGIKKEHRHTLTITSKQKEDVYFKIYKQSMLLADMQLNNLLKGYTYDYTTSPNTSISGSFEDKSTHGSIFIDSWFPISSKRWTANIVNGKFEIPMNLTEPGTFRIKFNGQTRPLFIAPGANLHITWLKNNRLNITGEGAADYKSVIGIQNLYSILSEVRAHSSESEIQAIIRNYKEEVDSVIEDYKDSLTFFGLNHVNASIDYNIAERFLMVLEDMEREKLSEKNQDVLEQMDNSARYMIQYLKLISFIATADKNATPSPAYHAFLKENLVLQQRLFLKDRGRRREPDNIDENIFFARVQYIGYPQYYCLYHLLEEQLLKGNSKKIKKQLNDFGRLPINPEMNNKLQELTLAMEQIEPKREFPLGLLSDSLEKAFTLKNGEFAIVDFSHLYFRNGNTQHAAPLKELTHIIKEIPEVKQFQYIAIHPLQHKGQFTETLSNDSVTFIYLYLSGAQWIDLDKLQLKNGYRTFLLDKAGRILSNDLGYIMHGSTKDFRDLLNEYFKSEQENQKAGESNNNIPIIIGLIFLFGVLTIGIIKIRSHRILKREAKKRHLKELELKAIRSQMNPHFIFNAMGSIQNLINQNKIKEANIYLASFAKLMRLVLNTSNKKLVSLSDEIDLVQHYLQLENLRVAFQYSIHIDDKIIPNNEEIPGMLIQPFVENAVIHGITPKGSGHIKVKFIKEHQYLFCTITDDGVGIQKENSTNGNGMALKLARKRVDLLNSETKDKVTLEVINRSSNGSLKQGTIIKLKIPVQ